MNDRGILRHVAVVHAALVAFVAVAFHALGLPLKGTLVGGGLVAFSFVTFWTVARAIVEPRRRAAAYLLGMLKITVYFALTAAVLTGRFTADPVGFALGVSVFVVATVLVAAIDRPGFKRRTAGA
jgi:hypothetical protein